MKYNVLKIFVMPADMICRNPDGTASGETDGIPSTQRETELSEQKTERFTNHADRKDFDAKPGNLKSLHVAAGDYDTAETELAGFANTLFYPVYRTDFAGKSDFAGQCRATLYLYIHI